MVSFFRDKSTASVFGIVFFSIVTRSSFLIHPPVVVSEANDGFIHYLLTPLLQLNSILLIILFHAIVVVQALRLNYALNDSRMMPRPTFTTALAYILLTALVPQWNSINGPLLINGLLIWTLFIVIKLSATTNPLRLIYNAGFIGGLISVLYYPAVPVIITLYFALAFVRPFRINEWMILLLGIVTPCYFLVGGLYLAGRMDLLFQNLPELALQVVQPDQFLFAIITFSVAGIATLLGIAYWQRNNSKMVIQVRSEWKFIFSLLIVLIPAVFVLPGSWPMALLITAVPAAAFVSNTFFYPRSSVFPALVFWILLGLIIYNNWVIAKL